MDDSSSDLSSLPSSSPASSSPPSRADSPGLSSRASSPLSVLSKSPSPPPPDMLKRSRCNATSSEYPTPPASQVSSQSGSPAPEMISVSCQSSDQEGPPAKKRRISKKTNNPESDTPVKSSDTKPHGPRYIHIRDGHVPDSEKANLDRLLKVLYKRQKIVVIAGAGISVSAGIPDFRSSNGLFNSLKAEHKLKGTGKDLFDASVYKDRDSTGIFQSMIQDLSRATKNAKPTAFHHMLATIASEGRLLRLYSQNVDGIDTSLEPLSTRVPLTKDHEGKWPRTVQLHGSLDKAVCSKCNTLSDFDADLFDGSEPPICSNCETVNDIRTNHLGKRSHGVGRLRPRMVLYNEHNPDDEAIGAVTREDLRRRPDAVVVVGTTLKVPGVRRIVREMCGVVRGRRGGVAVWINNDLPPAQKDFQDCWDVVVRGSCDEIAYKAAMRQWDDPILSSESEQVSDEEAQEAGKRTAEVHLPLSSIEHMAPLDPPSNDHRNNSFLPTDVATPRHLARHSPEWSPLTDRRKFLAVHHFDPPIGFEDESIAVRTNGLLTPSKSTKGSSPDPAQTLLPNVAERLKAAATSKTQQHQKPKIANAVVAPLLFKPFVVLSSKANGPQKKTTTKPRKTNAAKAKPLNPRNALNMTFAQSKSALPVIVPSKERAYDSIAVKNPSKLRTESSVSCDREKALGPLPPHDARSNGSPVHEQLVAVKCPTLTPCENPAFIEPS